HVRRGADGGVPRFRRRPRLSGADAEAADMARVAGRAETASTGPGTALRAVRAVGWAIARAAPIVLLALAWEALAASGAVTRFQLPRLSAVLARIWNDAVAGDLALNAALTLYRALVGFAVAAFAGVILGMAMSRNVGVRWLFDPIVSVGFPMPKIAF